jgi:hypothetical protein
MKRGIQVALCASVFVGSAFAADATWEGPFFWNGETYAGSGPYTSDSGTQWPYGQMTVHMSHIYPCDSDGPYLPGVGIRE